MRMLLAFIAALAIAGPAHASAGLFCQSIKSGGPSISLSITRGLPGGIFGATLSDGKTDRDTMTDDSPLSLVQAWIDDKSILVDIADREVTRYVAKLRARPRGEGAVGTLEVEGKAYAVRCEESG
jgi:hypothetical protein